MRSKKIIAISKDKLLFKILNFLHHFFLDIFVFSIQESNSKKVTGTKIMSSSSIRGIIVTESKNRKTLDTKKQISFNNEINVDRR